MPKAARERIANPRAGTALAPPFGLASREAPLDERDGRLVTEMGTDVKGNVAAFVTGVKSDRHTRAKPRVSMPTMRRVAFGN